MEINVRFSKFVDKTDESGKVLINPKNGKPLKTVVSTDASNADQLSFVQQSVDMQTLVDKLTKALSLGFTNADITQFGIQCSKSHASSITKF